MNTSVPVNSSMLFPKALMDPDEPFSRNIRTSLINFTRQLGVKNQQESEMGIDSGFLNNAAHLQSEHLVHIWRLLMPPYLNIDSACLPLALSSR